MKQGVVPPDECANCGAAIPRSARACPECGADERSGWREPNPYDGLNLPDEAYTDEEAPANQTSVPPRINGIAWYWWAVGIGLLVLLVSGALALRW
jgi:hypothetical protein